MKSRYALQMSRRMVFAQSSEPPNVSLDNGRPPNLSLDERSTSIISKLVHDRAWAFCLSRP